MNQNKNNTLERTALRWGLITFIMLSGYFILMKMLGLVHIIELRFLNAVIMFFGVYKAIKILKSSEKKFQYFKGIGVGALTAIIASGLFTAFGFLYILVIDTGFVADLKMNEPLGLYLNKYVAVMQIFIEGTISGFIFSYIIMQWLKDPRIDSED
jgi:hypothetical protein